MSKSFWRQRFYVGRNIHNVKRCWIFKWLFFLFCFLFSYLPTSKRKKHTERTLSFSGDKNYTLLCFKRMRIFFFSLFISFHWFFVVPVFLAFSHWKCIASVLNYFRFGWNLLIDFCYFVQIWKTKSVAKRDSRQANSQTD